MLPADIVQEIRDAGIMRMQMPRSWGGPEMTIMESVRVIEELAKADAWDRVRCSFIWADSGIYPAYLDDTVARELIPALGHGDVGLGIPGRYGQAGSRWLRDKWPVDVWERHQSL